MIKIHFFRRWNFGRQFFRRQKSRKDAKRAEKTPKIMYHSSWFLMVSFGTLTLASLTKSDSEIISCPLGWKPYNHKCYFYDSNLYNSEHIVQSCQFHHAKPVSIHSPDENKFVRSLITGNYLLIIYLLIIYLLIIYLLINYLLINYLLILLIILNN